MLIAATMRRLRHFFSALLVLSVVLFAARARAQSVSISNKTSLIRVNPDGTTAAKRTVNPEAFNYDDCLANLSVEITYLASGFTPNQQLEVWAGSTDCKPLAARTGTTRQCWRPFGNLSLQQTGTIRIPLRNVITRRADDTIGNYSADTSVCGGIPDSKFGLYFMFFQGVGTDPIGTTDQVDVQVKTLGPAALSGVSVLPGNRRLTVTWSATGEGGVADQQGIRVYCDPSPVSKSAETRTVTTCPDSSVADGGETDGATSSDAGCTTKVETVSAATECTSSIFGGSGTDGSAAVVPDSRYVCGELGGATGGRIVISTLNKDDSTALLENEKVYAVSIAAIDSFGNPGVLSTPVCGRPGETTDFWQLYRDSGGQAGGCSTESAPVGGLFSVFPLFVLALSLVRRRVRNRRTDSK